MSKNDFIYYCLDIPKCFKEGFIRALILTMLFTFLNFIDKYAFGIDLESAINSSIIVFENSFLSLFGIFVLISFVLRLNSRAKFLNKYNERSHSPYQKHKEWIKLN